MQLALADDAGAAHGPAAQESAPYRAGTAATVGPYHANTHGPADAAARRAGPDVVLSTGRRRQMAENGRNGLTRLPIAPSSDPDAPADGCTE